MTQVLADGTNTYLYGLGRIAERQGTASEYYLGDALDSVRQIANDSGNITLARNYEPFGKTSQTVGTAQTDYGFTGEFTDPSGLIYLRARYYESLTGRFTSRDSYEGDVNTPASLNRFNYAHSNPVMNTDPSGHCVFAVVDTLLCSIVIGGVVGYVAAGSLAGWIWDSAREGKCGCTETMQILSIPREQFVREARKQGAIWGAVFGFVAGTGPLGAVAASLVGMGMSTVQLMDAANKLRDNLQDKCAWIQFGAAMTGLGLSAVGTIGAYNAGVSTGQWIGWKPIVIGGGPVGFRSGYSGPSEGWPNLKPSDLRPGYNGINLEDAIADGLYRPASNLIGGDPALSSTAKFIYVIDEDGRILVTRNIGTYHHPDLVNGDNVLGAGEMYINQAGKIVQINDQSGHYLPQGPKFFGYLKFLLQNLGVKVSPGAIP